MVFSGGGGGFLVVAVAAAEPWVSRGCTLGGTAAIGDKENEQEVDEIKRKRRRTTPD